MSTSRVEFIASASTRLSPGAFRECIVASYRGNATRQSFREWCWLLGIDSNSIDTHRECQDWIKPEAWKALRDSCSSIGLEIALGNYRVRNKVDQTKSGWSNIMEFSSICSPDDDVYLYMAPSLSNALNLRTADENGDHLKAAYYLGIPSCCAEYFQLVWPAAARLKGDLCAFSCAMTSHHSWPWNWKSNIIAQYLYASPISFFPCRFTCEKAIKCGIESMLIMESVDKGMAEKIKLVSQGCYLYTEHDGIHRWGTYELHGNLIQLGRDYIGTKRDLRLSRAQSIKFHSPHSLSFNYSNHNLMMEGADVALCLF